MPASNRLAFVKPVADTRIHQASVTFSCYAIGLILPSGHPCQVIIMLFAKFATRLCVPFVEDVPGIMDINTNANEPTPRADLIDWRRLLGGVVHELLEVFEVQTRLAKQMA